MKAKRLKLLEGKTIKRVFLGEKSGPEDMLFIYFTDGTVTEINAKCEYGNFCGYYNPELGIDVQGETAQCSTK